MSYKHQMGFGLIMAIFFLVVLSSAGLYLANQMNDGLASGESKVTVDRTYYAAYSGLEWGIYSILNTLPCDATPTSLTTFSENDITLQVTCNTTNYTEGVSTIYVTNILSVAEYGSFPAVDYVQRQLTATIQHS